MAADASGYSGTDLGTRHIYQRLARRPNERKQASDWRVSCLSSYFQHAMLCFSCCPQTVSGQPSNLLGKMLHVFDQNWFKLVLRWCSDFNCIYTCRGSVVWLVLCWHSVSNFQFKFSTHPQGSPPPLFFVCLFSPPLFLLWLTSFTPSHLSISSHLTLKSLFQFQNALKPLPARRSLALPRDKTLGLFTFPLHCALLEGKVPRECCIRTIPGFNSVGKYVHVGCRRALRNKMVIDGSVSVDSTWNLSKKKLWMGECVLVRDKVKLSMWCSCWSPWGSDRSPPQWACVQGRTFRKSSWWNHQLAKVGTADWSLLRTTL